MDPSWRKKIVVLGLAATAAMSLSGPATASQSDDSASTGASATRTVAMVLQGNNLKFLYPDTVHAGDRLKIDNRTNPAQVGPHTFSLITRESRPRTAAARQSCFAPGHICRSIAAWHGAGAGPVTRNPSDLGSAGWDTMGTTSKRGDSVFIGRQPDPFTRVVSATAPTRIFFMCAIHTSMQGSIKVEPANN